MKPKKTNKKKNIYKKLLAWLMKSVWKPRPNAITKTSTISEVLAMVFITLLNMSMKMPK